MEALQEAIASNGVPDSISVQQGINKPRPSDDGSDAIRGHLEVSERDFEVIFQRVEAVEDPAVESLLAQLVPDMLDRVEFGAYRGRLSNCMSIGGEAGHWRASRRRRAPARCARSVALPDLVEDSCMQCVLTWGRISESSSPKPALTAA